MTTTGFIDMVAKRTTASRRIAAQPEAIFEVLTDAAKHPLIDGSGTVQAGPSRTESLTMGSRFGMNMRLKFLPYKIGSTVVEFEQDRLMAWQHFGRHRWRYELEPIETGTLVIETFDWSTSIAPKAIEVAGYPKSHLGNIERTLERLADLVEE